MTSKKKPVSKAAKVQLKDLKPKGNPKGGGATYCSGQIIAASVGCLKYSPKTLTE